MACIDQIVSIPAQSLRLSRSQWVEIRFSGGEPFLRYDDMMEISKYAINNGVKRIGCTTNAGWATTLNVARQKLKVFKNAGLHDLRLSCDHFHDFDKQQNYIRNAFKAAVELAIPVGIKVVIHKGSLRVSDILRSLEDITRDIIFFVEELSLLPVGRARELPDNQFLRQPGLPQGPCDILGNYSLDTEGNLYPCCAPGVPRLLKSGNINTEPLSESILNAENNSLYKIIQQKGPAYFVPFLRESGLDIEPGTFVNRCHLCQYVLNAADQNMDLTNGLNQAVMAWEKEQSALHSTLEVIENFL
jgi:hypothetical protein